MHLYHQKLQYITFSVDFDVAHYNQGEGTQYGHELQGQRSMVNVRGQMHLNCYQYILGNICPRVQILIYITVQF